MPIDSYNNAVLFCGKYLCFNLQNLVSRTDHLAMTHSYLRWHMNALNFFFLVVLAWYDFFILPILPKTIALKIFSGLKRFHAKNTKTNKTSHIVTQSTYRVKPDTNLGKSLEPGLQSGTHSPLPPLPHHKNKKMPSGQKKKSDKQEKDKEKTQPHKQQKSTSLCRNYFCSEGHCQIPGICHY